MVNHVSVYDPSGRSRLVSWADRTAQRRHPPRHLHAVCGVGGRLITTRRVDTEAGVQNLVSQEKQRFYMGTDVLFTLKQALD